MPFDPNAQLYGHNIMALGGLAPRASVVSGSIVLAQRLVACLLTAPDSVALDTNRHRTVDLRQFVNYGFNIANRNSEQAIASLVASILKQDEAVDDIQCLVALDPAASTLAVTVGVVPTVGVPFQLVLQVGQLTASLLSLDFGA